MIEFNCIDVTLPFDCDKSFQNWIEFVVTNEGFSLGDVVYVFSSDDYLLDVNRSYLNHDYYTDIITFDYTEDKCVSGDLFVSYERIIDHATLYNSSVKDEFLRVCVHGVLHLLGYKDKDDSDIKVMRSKELFYMDNFVSRET